MDKDYDKHPLAQLLGTRLAKDRKGLKSEEVAEQLGCATSTYRLAESGSITLNPSLGLKLAEIYDYDFPALAILLVALNTTNNLSTVNNIRFTLRRIGEADKDQRFGKFVQQLGEDFWSSAKTQEEKVVKNYIEENRLDDLLETYLRNPNFGIDEDSASEKSSYELLERIKTLPTIYSDFLEGFLQNTEELPVKVRFDSLGKWEKNNLPHFEKLYAVIKNHNTITAIENLKRYHYQYLWSPNFKEANFIFLNYSDSSKLKKSFSDNLRASIEASGDDGNKLKNFDTIMSKVTFKAFSRESHLCAKILSGTDFDVDGGTIEYDGFWVFLRNKKPSVSFLAFEMPHKKIPNYDVFVEGLSLNRFDTDEKIKLFNSAWSKLK